MKHLKRISILALCLALLCSMTLSASAATQSAKAATLRLEKTQGSVTVQNASGTAKKVTPKMKLLSGYTISTGKASYAYISLDSSKAIKLDASSKVSIQKAGKKLEVKVISGKVMFNVSAPLTSQESLTIRTSTMVTGVRGTAGWFESDIRSSSVYLLEGSLDVYSGGSSKPTNITSGQQLTAEEIEMPSGAADNRTKTTVEDFIDDDVPGFVATAVADDPALQQRMKEKDSPIDAVEVTKQADQKQKQDETAAAKREQQLQQQEQNAISDVTQNQNGSNPLFDNNKPSVSNPVPTPTPDPDPEPEPEPDPEPEPEISDTLLDPQQEDLELALSKFDSVSVSFTNEVGKHCFAGLTIPEEKTLELTGGIMDIVSATSDDSTAAAQSDLSFVIDGTMNIGADAMLRIDSAYMEISETGSLTNDGVLRYSTQKSKINDLDNYGTLVNNGTIDLKSGILTNGETSHFTNNETGIVFVNPSECTESVNSILAFKTPSTDLSAAVNLGEIYVYSNDAMDNYIHISENAALRNEGRIILETGNTKYCAAMYIIGLLQNNGTVCNGINSQIYNYGELDSRGTIENEGYFYTENPAPQAEEYDPIFSTISGTLNNAASGMINISQSGILALAKGAAINNFGSVSIFEEGSLNTTTKSQFNNYGSIKNDGAFHNSGTLLNTTFSEDEKTVLSGKITNESSGHFYNYGTLENVHSSNAIENFGYLWNGAVTEGDLTSVGTLLISDGKLSNAYPAHLFNEPEGSIVIGSGTSYAALNFAAPSDSTDAVPAENLGTISIKANASMSVGMDCVFINYGKLLNSGTVSNLGRIENDRCLVTDDTTDKTDILAGEIVNESNALFNNYGDLWNQIAITCDGTVYSPLILNRGEMNNLAASMEDQNGKTVTVIGSMDLMGGKLQSEAGSILRNEANKDFDTAPSILVRDRGELAEDFGKLSISGKFINNGGVTIRGKGKMTVNKDGTVIGSDGIYSIHVADGGTLENTGTLTLGCYITVENSTLKNDGTLQSDYYLTVSNGTLENSGEIFGNGSLFADSSTLYNTGTLTISSNASIKNCTVENLGGLINKGSIITDSSTWNNTGKWDNYTSVISNACTITNTGALKNIIERSADGMSFVSGNILLYQKSTLTNTAGSSFINQGILEGDNVMASLVKIGPSSVLAFHAATDGSTSAINDGIISVSIHGGKIEFVGDITWDDNALGTIVEDDFRDPENDAAI